MPAEAINDVGQIYIYIEKTPATTHSGTISVSDLNFIPQSMIFTNLAIKNNMVGHYGVAKYQTTSGSSIRYTGSMMYGNYRHDLVDRYSWGPYLYVDTKELYLAMSASETGADEYQFILVMFEKNIQDYDIT